MSSSPTGYFDVPTDMRSSHTLEDQIDFFHEVLEAWLGSRHHDCLRSMAGRGVLCTGAEPDREALTRVLKRLSQRVAQSIGSTAQPELSRPKPLSQPDETSTYAKRQS